MSQKNLALYKLADAAMTGTQRFESLDEVAACTGVSRSTAGRVSQELCEIGAAEWIPGSGELVLCSPLHILDLYKVTWKRNRSRIGYVTESDAVRLVREKAAVWGGCRAAVHHLNGFVPAMPYGLSIYVADVEDFEPCEEGSVPVYRWITRVLPSGDVAPMAQTLAELFSTPGWVSEDFYRALWDQCVGMVYRGRGGVLYSEGNRVTG